MGTHATTDDTIQTTPTQTATPQEEMTRRKGLSVAPKINIGKEIVGMSGAKKAKSILEATQKQAKSVRDWLLNSEAGFDFRDYINKEAQDKPEFLEMDMDVEEKDPDGKPVTVYKTVAVVLSIYNAKIEAYLNWGEEEFMKAFYAVETESLTDEEKQARMHPLVQRLIRRAAHTALWKFEVSKSKSLEELDFAIRKFFEDGYLEEALDEEVKQEKQRLYSGGKHQLIYGPEGKLYKLVNAERFGRMGDDTATKEEVCGIVVEREFNLKSFLAKEADMKDQQMVKGSEMTIENLWKGDVVGNGLCALSYHTQNNPPQKRVLQVKLDGNGLIWLNEASIVLVEWVKKIRDGKIRFNLDELFDEEGYLLKANDLSKPTASRHLAGTDLELWLERRRLISAFRDRVHYALESWMIRERGGRQNQQKVGKPALYQSKERPKVKSVSPETLRVIQQDLGYIGTISAIAWLVDGKPGDAVLVVSEFDGLEVMAIRMRRRYEDGKSLVSMTNAWREAEQHFDGLKNKEFEEKPRFDGVDDPLGKFLRVSWRQTKFPG